MKRDCEVQHIIVVMIKDSYRANSLSNRVTSYTYALKRGRGREGGRDAEFS